MANAQLKLGNTTFTLNASSDLSSLSTGPIQMGVVGDALAFEAQLTKPTGQISQFSVEADIGFAQESSWNVAGQSGTLTVMADAGVSGKLAVIKPGDDLFKYPKDSDGNDGLVQKARRGEQNCPYLRLSINVTFSVAGGAEFSFGALGVSASASAGRTFTVANYFACDPTMTLGDAIVAAFGAFVLPFNAKNAESMPDGAFLDYVFSGKIAVSAGLTYGVSLAAASLGQLKTSFDNGIVKAGIAPSLKVGASLDVKFEVDDSFRIIIGREHSPSQNVIDLCVGKVDKQSLGLDLGVELSASLGAQFNLQKALDKTLEKAAAPVLKGLPDNAKALALENFKNGLGQDAINQYLKDAQKQVDDFLKKVNTQKAAFTVAYERTHTNTQLFNYRINCDIPVALTAGYPAAIKCDFLTAMRTDGVELQPGSFLEDELSKKTTITLQLFNIFKAEDTVEFFRNLKTVYAGGGVFRVIFDTGVDWRSVFNGRSEDLKVFFEASAQTTDEATFQNANVTLNFVMADKKDAKRAALTASVLRMLNNSELSALADKITDTVQVIAQIDPVAFADLDFDPVKMGNRLNTGSHANDKRNYETFVANVEAIRTDHPFAGGLRSYENWVTYNRRANDQDGSTRPPDRADSGNLNTDSVWPSEFSNISDSATRRFISVDFEAGRQFMNLCEFLDRLDNDTLDEKLTKELFNSLLESLNSAVKNSPTVLTWYSKACLSTLAHLMSARVANVKGPAKPDDALEISFELEHEIAVSASGRR